MNWLKSFIYRLSSDGAKIEREKLQEKQLYAGQLSNGLNTTTEFQRTDGFYFALRKVENGRILSMRYLSNPSGHHILSDGAWEERTYILGEDEDIVPALARLITAHKLGG